MPNKPVPPRNVKVQPKREQPQPVPVRKPAPKKQQIESGRSLIERGLAEGGLV